LRYGTPDRADGTPDAPNVLISDNQELGDFLKENFIARLGAFREAAAFEGLKHVAATSVRCGGDPMSHRYTETVVAENLVVELVWEDLEEPKALELPPELTGTKAHTMFTLLVPANRAEIIVNGHSLPGEVGKRVQAGFETTTAFLYFSETWVLPPDQA
jgi:hypothetical protein